MIVDLLSGLCTPFYNCIQKVDHHTVSRPAYENIFESEYILHTTLLSNIANCNCLSSIMTTCSQYTKHYFSKKRAHFIIHCSHNTGTNISNFYSITILGLHMLMNEITMDLPFHMIKHIHGIVFHQIHYIYQKLDPH